MQQNATITSFRDFSGFRKNCLLIGRQITKEGGRLAKRLPKKDKPTWDARDYAIMVEYPNKDVVNRTPYYMEYLKKGLPNPKPKEVQKNAECKADI